MATDRKPFVRLETSLHREPWTRDEKMTCIELMMYLGDRWARDRLTADEACRATLTRHQLAAITGRSQLASARRSLRALSERVSLSIQVDGEFTTIFWPKFAKTQELHSRGRELETRPKPESAPAPAPAPSQAQRTGQEHGADAPCVTDLVLVGNPVDLVDDGIVSAGLLVRLLAHEPGEHAEKLAWLESNLPLMICEVQALDAIKTRQQAMAKLRTFVFRWWKHRCRNPDDAPMRSRYESFDEARVREGKEWLASL